MDGHGLGGVIRSTGYRMLVHNVLIEPEIRYRVIAFGAVATARPVCRTFVDAVMSASSLLVTAGAQAAIQKPDGTPVSHADDAAVDATGDSNLPGKVCG